MSKKTKKLIVSYIPRPVSNTVPEYDFTWPEFYQRMYQPPTILNRASHKEKAAKGDYYTRGPILPGKTRSDENIPKSYLIIIDVDKPLEGYPYPTPDEVAAAASEISTTLNVPFIFHTTATEGNSRVIFLSKPFKRKHSRAITRHVYNLFKKLDCHFRFASESITFSQPWFFPQTTKKQYNAGKYLILGNPKGKPFKWKEHVEITEPTLPGVRVASTRMRLSDSNQLEEFLMALASGTIHEAAKKYIGWQVRTTNLTLKQIIRDVTALIETNYVQTSKENKLERWKKFEAKKMLQWFESNNFDRNVTPTHTEPEEDRQGIQTASEATSREVEWLWHNVIHKNKFNLLSGDSGSNKTTLALRLAAHITTGKPFPDTPPNHPKPKPGGVLLITSEDDLEDTILPRLEAVHADKEKFFFCADNYDFNRDGIQRLQQDVDDLEKLSGIKLKMIIVDPIDSYTGSANTNLSSVVKRICNQFNKFARKNDLCFLGIMHFKKVTLDGQDTLKNAISGSYAWTSTPRSVMCLLTDPTEPQVKYFGVLKNNNADINYHYTMFVDIKDGEVSIKIGKKTSDIPIETQARFMLRSKTDRRNEKLAKSLYNYCKLNDIPYIPCTEAKVRLRKMAGGIKNAAEEAAKFFKYKNVNGTQCYVIDSFAPITDDQDTEEF